MNDKLTRRRLATSDELYFMMNEAGITQLKLMGVSFILYYICNINIMTFFYYQNDDYVIQYYQDSKSDNRRKKHGYKIRNHDW